MSLTTQHTYSRVGHCVSIVKTYPICRTHREILRRDQGVQLTFRPHLILDEARLTFNTTSTPHNAQRRVITGMEQEADQVSSCAIQHGQLSDRVDDAQQQPQSIATSAGAELSTVTTPVWPLSPPPSGYATPAVAVTSLAADAQAQTTPSGSQSAHPGSDGYATTTLYASRSQSAWPTYTTVSSEHRLTVSGNSMSQSTLQILPNELLLDILGHLDVCDLLATSRVSETSIEERWMRTPPLSRSSSACFSP